MRPQHLTPTRKRLSGWTMAAAFSAGDVAAVALAGLLAAAVAGPAMRSDATAYLTFIVGAGILIWSLSATDAYRLGQSETLPRHLMRVRAAFAVAGLLLVTVVAAFRPVAERAQPLGLWFWLSFVALYNLHALWWTRVRAWRRRGRLTPNIVVLGATANARQLISAALDTREVAVLGVFDDRLDAAPGRVGGVPVLGDLESLIHHPMMPSVDRVVITVSSLAQSRVRELIDRLSVLPNEIMLFVDHDGEAGRDAALLRIIDAPLARVAGSPSDERRALVKRVQDLVIGSLALLVGLPAMLLVAAAIRLDSPGPILFRQRRHGFNNEQIVVWKFRSMRADAVDAAASRQVGADDDRVTRVGRFIRQNSLDELPQILNVLKGEMSLVGPRPHAVGMKTGETESSRLVAHYAHRHRLKPGMTGWAAVNGSRGPVDTPELVRRRVALDIEYIERQSFWLDLWIMARTVPCLIGDKLIVR